MPMKGKMDQLASDLATGKIKLNEKEKTPEKKIVGEQSRLAVLIKTHEDHQKTHNRSAQEAMALMKHHKSHGEHEMAGIYKDLAHAYHETAALHKKLCTSYGGRKKK